MPYLELWNYGAELEKPRDVRVCLMKAVDYGCEELCDWYIFVRGQGICKEKYVGHARNLSFFFFYLRKDRNKRERVGIA